MEQAKTSNLNKHSSDGVRDLTQGSPYSVILSFAFPFFISQVFQQLYNVVDSLIVGRFLGTTALAAVSTSGTLIFMIVSFFEGAALGGSVVIARYFGAKDEERVSLAIHTAVTLALVMSVFMTAFGVLFTPQILRWMNTDPDVLPEAVSYFRTIFAGCIGLVVYNMGRSVMVAVGDSKRPLYYLIFSALTNIVLDYLFVGVFGWGVWAAAFATILSQSLSAVFCIGHLLQKGHVYTLSLSKLGFDMPILWETIKYGMPSGIQNSVIGFANVIVLSQINSFGTFAMAAFGSHAKIEGFAFIPIMALNLAVTTFISQNLGAKEYARAKQGARFCMTLSPLLAEIIGVIYYFHSPLLIGLFDKTPEVLELGVTQAHIIPLFYFLLAFSHAVAAVCRGAGKAFVPMFVMLSVWCVIRVAYILLVMNMFGDIWYVYWAYPLTWGISSVIYLIYYLFSDWVHGFESKSDAK
ncbi:MAG: MATE family efflux transporter [Clostridiales bacterium]|nr:MATE family efflux transporter [Clostridiales bacterium]